MPSATLTVEEVPAAGWGAPRLTQGPAGPHAMILGAQILLTIAAELLTTGWRLLEIDLRSAIGEEVIGDDPSRWQEKLGDIMTTGDVNNSWFNLARNFPYEIYSIRLRKQSTIVQLYRSGYIDVRQAVEIPQETIQDLNDAIAKAWG